MRDVSGFSVSFLRIALGLVIVGWIVSFALVFSVRGSRSGGDVPTDAGVTDARSLPEPEPAGGERGEMGVDANVNEETIDSYLGMDGVVYRDMRMLDDDANFEAIGGDSMLSGYVEGFEVVPYPYLVPVEGLPEAVGKGYDGPTLFVRDDGGDGYVPAFEESMDVLEDLFPKDSDIVLMCGAGGYAGDTKRLLVSLGWDGSRIWNAGGWWYYKGSHGVDVRRENAHGNVTWDFHAVPYHVIDFDALNPVGGDGGADADAASGGLSEVVEGVETLSSQAELDELVADGRDTFVYVYLPGCSSCAEFAPVVGELADTGEVRVVAVSYGELSDELQLKAIGHAPGVMVFRDGELVASLSPDRDSDKVRYSSLEELTKWLGRHVDVAVSRGVATADVDCEEGCDA